MVMSTRLPVSSHPPVRVHLAGYARDVSVLAAFWSAVSLNRPDAPMAMVQSGDWLSLGARHTHVPTAARRSTNFDAELQAIAPVAITTRRNIAKSARLVGIGAL
jgi:hypothetical protein